MKRVNVSENLFEQLAAKKGWKVTKRGWPDFIGLDSENRLIAIEVKPRCDGGQRYKILKDEQVQAMNFLSSAGIRCFVSDGLTIEPYHPMKHSSERFPLKRYKSGALVRNKKASTSV